MKVTLKFMGGAEALFGNVASRDVDLTQILTGENTTDDVKATTPDANTTDEGKSSVVWTIGSLLVWLRNSSGFLTGEESLFFSDEAGVRNGIMVLVNDCDWELLGELDYELAAGDTVVFISTLHGG